MTLHRVTRGAVLGWLALCVALPLASAENGKSPASASFRKLDADRDGFLSRKEISGVGAYAKSFDDADENRDGKLDPTEFVQLETIVQRAKLPASTDDKVITEKVRAALLKQPALNGSDIEVKTERGRVLLSGTIRNENQRDLALKAAARVDGVIGVKDSLTAR